VTKFVAAAFNGDIVNRQIEVHGRNRVASLVVCRLFDGETASVTRMRPKCAHGAGRS
jgi:hypothetical protein